MTDSGRAAELSSMDDEERFERPSIPEREHTLQRLSRNSKWKRGAIQVNWDEEMLGEKDVKNFWSGLIFRGVPNPVSYTHLTLPTTPYV